MEEYYRLEFEWDTLTTIRRIHPIEQTVQEQLEELTIYPATPFCRTARTLKEGHRII